MSNARDAAADVLSDIFADEPSNEAPAQPVSATAEPVVEANEPTEDPQMEAQPEPEEMPDDLKALLADVDEDPIVEAAPPDDEEDEPESYVEETYEDPEAAKLRKQLAKAQKSLEWHKQRELDRGRKVWKEEAKKYLPYSTPFLDNITAESRRGFLREAAKYHEANKSYLEKQAAPHVQAAAAQAKAEAAAAWGKPSAGPGTAPLEASQAQAQWEEARQRRDPLGMIKARGFHKLVD